MNKQQTWISNCRTIGFIIKFACKIIRARGLRTIARMNIRPRVSFVQMGIRTIDNSAFRPFGRKSLIVCCVIIICNCCSQSIYLGNQLLRLFDCFWCTNIRPPLTFPYQTQCFIRVSLDPQTVHPPTFLPTPMTVGGNFFCWEKVIIRWVYFFVVESVRMCTRSCTIRMYTSVVDADAFRVRQQTVSRRSLPRSRIKASRRSAVRRNWSLPLWCVPNMQNAQSYAISHRNRRRTCKCTEAHVQRAEANWRRLFDMQIACRAGPLNRCRTCAAGKVLPAPVALVRV